MEVSGQLQAPAALILGKGPPVPFDQDSVSQPPGCGPGTGPSSCRKNNLPGRGLTKVDNHWTRRFVGPQSQSGSYGEQNNVVAGP
jgi:hypothetical protein